MARQLAQRSGKFWPTEHDELQSAACMALAAAARAYDPSRKVGFGSYARHRIRGALRDLQRILRSNGQRENVPRPSYRKLRVFDDEKAQQTSVTPAHSNRTQSAALERWLNGLPKAQATACRLIYVHAKTPDEVAAAVGCSKSFLFRLHREAVLKLIADYDKTTTAE
jgi:RNA polymerase sigma factor (sigma-70 family)